MKVSLLWRILALIIIGFMIGYVVNDTINPCPPTHQVVIEKIKQNRNNNSTLDIPLIIEQSTDVPKTKKELRIEKRELRKDKKELKKEERKNG